MYSILYIGSFWTCIPVPWCRTLWLHPDSLYQSVIIFQVRGNTKVYCLLHIQQDAITEQLRHLKGTVQRNFWPPDCSSIDKGVKYFPYWIRFRQNYSNFSNLKYEKLGKMWTKIEIIYSLGQWSRWIRWIPKTVGRKLCWNVPLTVKQHLV